MKKNLLLVATFLLAGIMSTFAQDTYGPDYFETYTENFDDESADGFVPVSSEAADWSVSENANTSGGLQFENSNGADMVHSVLDNAIFENYTLSATIYPVWGNKTGIIFNYQDEDNYYVVEHWANANTLYVRQKVNGTWETGEGGDSDGGYMWGADSLLFNTYGGNRVDTNVASDWYETGEFANTIKLKNGDGLTSVWFNDVLIFEKIQTAEFTSGKVGFFTHWCPAFFDDLVIESNASQSTSDHFGPGVFETYTENFDDETADDFVPVSSDEADWSVSENTNTSGGLQFENSNGADMVHSIYDAATYENYTVSASIYPVWGNKTGIIFNYQDEDNFYVVEHAANENTLYLRQKVNGTWETGEGGDSDGGYMWNADSLFFNTYGGTRIDTNVASDWYETGEFANTMKVKNGDGLTSVWFNDVLIFEDIQTNEFTSGKLGFFTHWCPAFFDNFVVESNAAISVDEVESSAQAIVYPNPVDGEILKIDTKGFDNKINLTVYDMTGKLLYNENDINSGLIEFNTGSILPNSGIYLFKVTSEKKTIVNRVVVK